MFYAHHFVIHIHRTPIMAFIGIFFAGLLIATGILFALEKNPNLFQKLNTFISTKVVELGHSLKNLWQKICTKLKQTFQPTVDVAPSGAAMASLTPEATPTPPPGLAQAADPVASSPQHNPK